MRVVIQGTETALHKVLPKEVPLDARDSFFRWCDFSDFDFGKRDMRNVVIYNSICHRAKASDANWRWFSTRFTDWQDAILPANPEPQLDWVMEILEKERSVSTAKRQEIIDRLLTIIAKWKADPNFDFYSLCWTEVGKRLASDYGYTFKGLAQETALHPDSVLSQDTTLAKMFETWIGQSNENDSRIRVPKAVYTVVFPKGGHDIPYADLSVSIHYPDLWAIERELEAKVLMSTGEYVKAHIYHVHPWPPFIDVVPLDGMAERADRWDWWV